MQLHDVAGSEAGEPALSDMKTTNVPYYMFGSRGGYS